MRPRALSALSQASEADAFPILAEGLGLIGEHVEALARSMGALSNQEEARGHQVLDLFATEEAAKALIILDLARCRWNNSAARGRLLKGFYNHTIRLVCAQVHQGSPADFAEVAGYVDDLRASHYLDGPNDVDWIFRNHLEAAREDTLYVDRVAWGDGSSDTWVTPLDRVDRVSGPSEVVELVLALRRLGVLSLRGLQVCQEIWAQQDLVWVHDYQRPLAPKPTRWTVCRDQNFEVVKRMNDEGLASPDASEEDLRLVLEQWTFPLGHLDLSVKRVSLEELRAVQARALARLNGGE